MDSSQIRQIFLDFFSKKGHEIVASAPMVVKNDPTLMFINAGMNQFKELFLGNAEIKHNRIADTQKCLRVSGKHNDLEEVGVDTYHHTMFEMLGNWSFGDYFKKEAIEWAWELLVDVYKVDKNRLYFTVFEGDKEDETPFDAEAYDLWKAVLLRNGLTEERILKCDKKDNFWEMGDTGPCGPCSEIHIDIRSEEEIEKIPGKELVNKDHPQVIEIWNLVFMEFNRMANGDLKALSAKHVDTGMGFERLAMVLQGKTSNYDSDVFSPIIDKIVDISGIAYRSSESKEDVAIRVISDHLRAVTFAIADGQLPSNNGAGYVIRRILRRAIRYGYSFLNLKEPFIYNLVQILESQLTTFFPELSKQRDIITKVIKEEEENFLRTLAKGITRFETYLSATKDHIIDGQFAFELYDTFGFPIDLTELLASENGFDVDMEGFSCELQKQKDRSRAIGKIEAEDWIEQESPNKEEFVGYDFVEAEVFITKYRKVKSKGTELYQLVFNKTPFYPEGGGQVGDKGYLEGNGEKIQIIDTKKENNLIVHFAEEIPSDPTCKFKAIVETTSRDLSASNHSATHLLHQALREVLGEHVEQKGSLVNPEYLRFDFSHFEKLKEAQLVQIEELVNGRIQEDINLQEFRSISIKEAEEKNAIMLFGEKYGDQVRMIQFGESKELCGGIHVKSTKEIGFFKIKSEGSTASGIRRIEALTSSGAYNWITTQKIKLNAVEELIKDFKLSNAIKEIDKLKEKLNAQISLLSSVHKKEPLHTIEVDDSSEHLERIKQATLLLNEVDSSGIIIDELNNYKKQLAKEGQQGNKEKLKKIKDQLLNQVEVVGDVNVIGQKIELADSTVIKDLAFQLKAQVDRLFLVLGAEVNEKPNLTIIISDSLVKEKDLHAGNIIREVSKEIRGGGGGQPFYATAGGSNVAGIETAINKAKDLMESKL